MAWKWANGIEGTLSADLASGGTTLEGAALADLPVISGDQVAVVIDPDEDTDSFEVVYVTAHTLSATTATISRAKEGTTSPSNWPSGTKFVAAITKAQLEGFEDDIDTLETASSTAAADIIAIEAWQTDHEDSFDEHPLATTDDPGFMSAAHYDKLEGIETGAQVNPTDAEVFAQVLAEDGPGTGLNADLLDGEHASAFADAVHTHDDRYYTESEIAAKDPEQVRAYLSSAKSVPSASVTGITCSSEERDDWGGHSSGSNRINDAQAGYYWVQAQAVFQSNTGGYRQIQIKRNGSIVAVHRLPPVSGDTTIVQVGTMLYLDGTDYCDFEVYQDSGSTLTLTAGNSNTWISMTRLFSAAAT